MNSPNEPEAMEDSSHTCTWTQSKLGDVAHYVNDKIIGREISIEQYVSTENMLVDKGGIVKAAIVPEESKITKYCAGDILISNIRPYFKKIWLAKHDGGCSTDVLVIRTKKGMDANFLYYSLTQDKFFDYVVAGSKGTKMPRGDKNAILEFSVPKPHLQEQEEIGKILSALDSKIELNQQMNKTLESIAQTLFKHWFIDFEFPDENGQPYKSSGGEMVDSEIGPIPLGWTIVSFTDEFNVVMGQSPPGSTYNDVGNGEVFFQGRTDFGDRFPTERVYCTEPKKSALKGDTLMSVRAPVGDLNMANQNCSIGRGLATVRHKSNSISYTYYYMKTLQQRFKVFESKGTVFGAITKNDFKEMKIWKAPIRIISTFEDLVYPLDHRIENSSTLSFTLVRMRDILLPRLISGKIRVPLEDTNV